MKILVRNRRNPGWSLLEVIVAVAILAILAAATMNAYNAALQRANVQKAEALISQIEMIKQTLHKSIDFGECAAPADNSALAARILSAINVAGVTLTGIPGTDAHSLGFADISVGTIDTVDGNGNVTIPGTPARVTLNNGVVIPSASR